MSLSDLASIGSFVSALAVLASLVYLALQLQQADRNQRASIRAARATRMIDLFLGGADSSVAEAFVKGMQGAEDLSETQLVQFTNCAYARFFNAEDSFYQHREGLLNDFYFQGVANGLRGSLAAPGLRAFYRRQRDVLGPEFVAFADQVLAATPVAAKPYSAADFRADVAAERATAAASTGAFKPGL